MAAVTSAAEAVDIWSLKPKLSPQLQEAITGTQQLDRVGNIFDDMVERYYIKSAFHGAESFNPAM